MSNYLKRVPIDNGSCGKEPDEGESLTSGVRREARCHIPGTARKNSKEVLRSTANPMSKDKRNKSMLSKAWLSEDVVRQASARPDWYGESWIA